jgi:hypothetical protein
MHNKNKPPEACPGGLFFVHANLGTVRLFPLNCCRRLRSNVIDDTVNVVYFVHDTHGNFLEHIPRNTRPVGCHTVNRGYGADAENLP